MNEYPKIQTVYKRDPKNPKRLLRGQFSTPEYDLNIDRVPVIGYGDLYDMVHMTEEGFSSQWGSFPAEGIVARPTIEMFSKNGDRIITKIKYRDFQE